MKEKIMAEKVDRYGSDVFGKIGSRIKEEAEKEKKLKYPYDEEDLRKWKDKKLKKELIKLRATLNKRQDVESEEYDMLTTELAKLQKEADRRRGEKKGK